MVLAAALRSGLGPGSRLTFDTCLELVTRQHYDLTSAIPRGQPPWGTADEVPGPEMGILGGGWEGL